MAERSTKPYLIRAIHEWCADSNFTPYISVRVDANTRVPPECVKNGEIVLNVSYDATHKLTIGNDLIQFAARFGGVSRECSIPIESVLGIFARENGQGLFFAEGQSADTPAAGQGNGTAGGQGAAPASPNGGKPKLQIVK